MLLSALAFLAGICACLLSPGLPEGNGPWLLPALLPMMLRGPVLRSAGLAVAGFLWAGWQAGQIVERQLPAGLEGRDLSVRGVVSALPESLPGQRLRFRFHIEQARIDGRWQELPLSSRLSWYRHAPSLRPGERWQLRVRLKRPRGFANPAGFDYERWLFAQRIGATGYVRRDDGNGLIGDGGGYRLQRLRQSLSQHIDALDLPGPMHGLLRALAIGDRSGMSPAQWRVLRHTGTGHLMAISGLHVGLVAALVFALAARLWRRLGRPQDWPAARAAAVSAMLAALFYALLAGFQVPAQRALIMVWLAMLALIRGGRVRPWPVWGLALLLVLLLDPLAVLGAGLWLSFGAVAAILYLAQGRHGPSSRLQRLLSVQFGLVAGLTPLLWLWFQQAAPLAPLANLVAIPWVGMLVVPLLLLGVLCLPLVPVIGDALLWLAAWLLQALWWLLEQMAALPASLWPLPSLSGGWLLLLSLGLLCLLAPRAFPLRPVAAALVLPALLVAPGRPDAGDLWLTLLDVGQGLSVVLQTRVHSLVYDTGPAFRSGFNTGDAVVVPFLQARGYRRLDRLVISHADNDHSGGGAAVFRNLDVRAIDAGEPQAIDWARSQRCHAGEGWIWDGVRFDYLAPGRGGEGNNASCVLRVETAAGRVLLLPGDIERSVERTLLQTAPGRLAAEVLVVPHHGSRTSSLPAFVEAVDPRLALFAVGYRNRFGFPKDDVVARYHDRGARLLDTASAGAVEIRLEGTAEAAVSTTRTAVAGRPDVR